MKIRFEYDMQATVAFEAGDEIVVRRMTPGLQSLINATRIDGCRVVRVIKDEYEDAVLDTRKDDTATVGGRKRGGSRSTTVS